MRWRGDRQSSNVEDRSGGGRPVGKIATGGGIGVFLIHEAAGLHQQLMKQKMFLQRNIRSKKSSLLSSLLI